MQALHAINGTVTVARTKESVSDPVEEFSEIDLLPY